MRLVSPSISGRAFLLQFIQIMGTFGNEIPWLQPLRALQYHTKARHFRDGLLKGLGCREAEDVQPFQLVSSDGEYLGGCLHLACTPERFTDRSNRRIMGRLNDEGGCYVSCLHVRDDRGGYGYGNMLVRQMLNALLASDRKVWGVVSDPRVLRWHVQLGAKVWSPPHNSDRVWIVSYQQEG